LDSRMRTSFAFSQISRKRASWSSCLWRSCCMHASRSKGAMEPYDKKLTRLAGSHPFAYPTRNKHVIYRPSSHHYATHPHHIPESWSCLALETTAPVDLVHRPSCIAPRSHNSVVQLSTIRNLNFCLGTAFFFLAFSL
jgi:hypothetical protein